MSLALFHQNARAELVTSVEGRVKKNADFLTFKVGCTVSEVLILTARIVQYCSVQQFVLPLQSPCHFTMQFYLTLFGMNSFNMEVTSKLCDCIQ
jgi:hypothetical protein